MDNKTWLRLLNRFGQPVAMVKGEQRQEFFAFFQPVRDENPENHGKFLYLGPPDPAPEIMDSLESNGKRYRFIRYRPMYNGDTVSYQWGIAELEE